MAALDRFDALYDEDPLPEFYKVVDPLLKWALEIFAFHRTGRNHQRPTRGHHAKLAVLKLMAYGFVNASNFEARGLLLCPPLPRLGLSNRADPRSGSLLLTRSASAYAQ